MKEALQILWTATYSLLFFKPYTVYPRSSEIAMGIMAWGCVAIMLWPLLKHIS